MERTDDDVSLFLLTEFVVQARAGAPRPPRQRQGSGGPSRCRCHQTSPGRQPQLMGAVRSSRGDDGVGSTRM
jgi:hypothetical protein